MIELPGLHGDDALGFLAAVGLVALGEQQAIPPLRLGWSDDASPVAQVDAEDIASLDELGERLRAALTRLADEGRALPGVDADFPVAPSGVGTDPMRGTRDQATAFHQAGVAAWNRGDPWRARWTLALCGQSVTDAKDRVALTPFYAPTGQMKLRSSVFDATAAAALKTGGPGDALTRWRRPGFDGANFDERARRDGAVSTAGSPANQGAPSPTWLVTMGLRFFPLVERGGQLQAVGWQRVRLYPRPYTTRSLIWPTWRPMLGPAGVRAMLGSGALRIEPQPEPHVADPSSLPALGITGVFGSSRRTLSQGDGPLGPARRLWSG